MKLKANVGIITKRVNLSASGEMGEEAFGYPVISTRQFTCTIKMTDGKPYVFGGMSTKFSESSRPHKVNQPSLWSS